MTSCEMVREHALALPEAEEHDHWGRPSFRVRGKIFATLWTAEHRAVVKMDRETQMEAVRENPKIFSPVPGAWGGRGYTNVALETISPEELAAVLKSAWAAVAPKKLAAALE